MRKFLFCLLTFLLFCNDVFAQNLNVIEDELQNVLTQRRNERVSINIVLKSQINSVRLQADKSLDKTSRREYVVNELKSFASNAQNDILSVLQAEERIGNVENINSNWIVNSITCDATKDVIYKLSSHPDIAIISYNNEIQLIEEGEVIEMSAAPTRGPGHHIVSVNADDVWNIGYTGKNVVVAVLDSGTNIYHYDIRNRLWTGEKNGEEIHGWNYTTKDIEGDSNIHDEYGHGTHCAGIVCGDGTSGTSSGVAPDALLMTVKIVGRTGTGSVQQMISGVQFAIDNGADVLSMSLGFKNKDLTQTQKETIRQTFDNALSAGVIVCAAAGNDGTSTGTPYNVDYPAACPSPWSNPDQTIKGGLSSVVCVGADDLVGQSSQGPSTWEDTKYNEYPYNNGESMGLIRPDISAPGNLVMSLNHNQIDMYKLMSGTSQATPCVAGVIALMLEKNPNLNPAQICEIIETTTSNKPQKKNNIVGSGRIDALAAINAITSQNSNPYLKISSFSPETTLQGNNISLNITMKNSGKAATSASTTATLETCSQYVTINSATTTVGSVDMNNTKTITYSINILPETPNNHYADFTVNVTDGSLSWKEKFTVKVSSLPEIVFKSVSPGIINADIETNINVTIQNQGNGPTSGNTNIELMTIPDALKYITLTENETTIGSLGVNETATATFKIKASDETPNNKEFDFFLMTASTVETKTNIIYEFESDMQGWTTFDGNNDQYNNPYFHSNDSFQHMKTPKHSHSGTGHLMSETMYYSTSESETPLNNFIVSPKFKVSSDSKISFWARAHHETYYAENFGIAVSTASNNNASDFATIKQWNISKSDGTNWKQYTIDLSAYAGKEIYIAIRHFFSKNQWTNLLNGYEVEALCIDDVMLQNVYINNNHVPTFDLNDPTHFSIIVDNNIDLPAPTGLTATANGTDKINLEWNAVAKAKSYNIYRDGEYIANVATVTYTDNNLKHNTEYCYEVAAVYAGSVYEHSETVCVKTATKDYSAAIKDFSPKIIEVDGETAVAMDVTIINDGKYEFKARASYTLTCNDDTHVTITNNNDKINVLAPNAKVTKTINIKVGKNIPDDHVIKFNLNILSMVTDPSQWEYYKFDMPFEVAVNNPPRAPKNVTTKNVGSKSVTLGWSAANNAISYNIYRDGILIDNAYSTIYIDNNVEKETTYCYKVTTVTAMGESDFSEEICATTLAEDKGILVQSYELSELVGAATMKVTLINKSDAATTKTTTATLTCDDQYVTIVNGTAIIGDIDIDETATAEFKVIINNDIPNDYNLPFNVVVETECEKLGDLEYNFNSDFEGWTNYIWTLNNYTWEYDETRHCITSHSYKNNNSREPDNLICSPVKIKVSDNTQVIWDVAASGAYYFAEYYGVFLVSDDPVGSYGWATESLKNKSVFEKKLDNKYSNYNFVTETANASPAADTGDEVWVVFRHFNCENQDRILIDNIKITNVYTLTPVYHYNTIYVTANPSFNIFEGSGSWNNASNWSKGVVPAATDNVVINGKATIESGDVIVETLTIKNYSLTINSGASLTVNGKMTSDNKSSLIISDGAQIIQSSANVHATFKMGIANPEEWGETQDGWQFIASPFINASVSCFTEIDSYDLYKYEGEADLQWNNQKDGGFDDEFVNGRGYLVSYATAETATLYGTLSNAKTFDYDLTFDAEKHLANFHLLGNPFTFNMDWKNISVENVYNGFATVNPADGAYIYDTEGIIPVGNGFFVKATGENPSISYATTKSRGGKAEYINVTASGKDGSDNVIIKLSDHSSDGFAKLDNLNQDIANIYVKSANNRYGIMDYGNDVKEVELFFDAKKMGNYTIEAMTKGRFEYVTLVDRTTGIETNMLIDSYSFTSTGQERPDRFLLKFEQGSETESENFAYLNGEDLIIEAEGSLQIIDIMGRVVYSNDVEHCNNRINVSKLKGAAYIVRVIGKDDVKIQKIII